MSVEKIAVIGASRGLGHCFFDIAARPDPESAVTGKVAESGESSSPRNFILVSRRGVEPLSGQNFFNLTLDLSVSKEQERLIRELTKWHADRVFYFAGGGPHGAYHAKQWRDHEWSWQVRFVAAARLLHALMMDTSQIIFIGSNIAGDRPDPMAASYAAAKHALKGLIESVQAEVPACDVRLYSPGYMDTELLPRRARPRVDGHLLADPRDVALDLWQWSEMPHERCKNRCYPERD